MNKKNLTNYAIGGAAVLLAYYAYRRYYSQTNRPRLIKIN